MKLPCGEKCKKYYEEELVYDIKFLRFLCLNCEFKPEFVDAKYLDSKWNEERLNKIKNRGKKK